MFKLILSVGIISVLAACSNMSRDATSSPTSGRASSATMGAPAGIGGYGPGSNTAGGPN